MEKIDYEENTRQLKEEGKLWKASCCMNCLFREWVEVSPYDYVCKAHKAVVEMDDCCGHFSINN